MRCLNRGRKIIKKERERIMEKRLGKKKGDVKKCRSIPFKVATTLPCCIVSRHSRKLWGTDAIRQQQQAQIQQNAVQGVAS